MMPEKICQNCGEVSPLSAKYCRYCGEEIETVASPQPVRRVAKPNRVDEFVQEVRVSNVFTTTLKVYLSFIFITFCLFPALCLFLGMLGLIPLNTMLNELFRFP